MDEAGIRRCRPLLGTFVEIAAPAGTERAIEAAYAEIGRLHALMSFHDEGSDLAALRRSPPGETVAVDPATVEVLALAGEMFVLSDGLFDVTIGVELVEHHFLPRPVGVEAHPGRGTGRDIVIVDTGHVRCDAPLLIDLGGIAKGYAVDRAVRVLADAGVTSAIVNAGGDLRVLGDRAETIHLREADGSIAFSVEIADAALASSGDADLVRSGHDGAISPYIGRDRRPIDVGEAVSIVADRCVVADALTKVVLADPVRGAMLASRFGAEVIACPSRRCAA
nr:FAD:protein FMN transferase [uncultured Sphingomonas sp.]